MRVQVKKNLEEAERAGGREANKKNVVQKVSCLDHSAMGVELTDVRRYSTN